MPKVMSFMVTLHGYNVVWPYLPPVIYSHFFFSYFTGSLSVPLQSAFYFPVCVCLRFEMLNNIFKEGVLIYVNISVIFRY